MKPFNIGDLKIPVPIIQGGMGIGIYLSELASAVANMGGVVVISIPVKKTSRSLKARLGFPAGQFSTIS